MDGDDASSSAQEERPAVELPALTSVDGAAIDFATLEQPGVELGSGAQGVISLCGVETADGDRTHVIVKRVSVRDNDDRLFAANEALAMHALCGTHPALPVFLAAFERADVEPAKTPRGRRGRRRRRRLQCTCSQCAPPAVTFLIAMRPFQYHGGTLFEAIDMAERARRRAKQPNRPPGMIWTPLRRNADVRIVEQLHGALAFIHAAGYAHRDVKPENVLFDPESGAVQLIDFGGAINAERLEQSRDLLFGTLLYLPAEMIPLEDGSEPFADAELDDYQRADLFALGLTAYELAVLHTFDEQLPPYKLSQVHRAHRAFAGAPSKEDAFAALEWPANVRLGDVREPRLARLIALVCAGNPHERPASACEIKF